MQKNTNFSTDSLQMTISKFTHELRNPLSLIYSEFQLFITAHPEASDWKEILEIHEQLDYLNELLQEFSHYSNADRLSLKPTNIREMLLHTAASFQPTLEYLNIRLVTEISPALPVILLDSVKIRQAIMNLLKNALESISHDHGEIHLIAHHPNSDQVVITISDNGCGIPPEKLPDIESPFVTYKSSGTGLGLAITKQIIEAHGGCLSIQSSLQTGTCVSITLPVPQP